jgi:putative ABC transport system ATP-binding protein
MQIELNDVAVDIPKTGRELFKLKRLEISSGSKLLIHGASGKGKTTLLHLIAGLLLPRSGKVTLGQHQLHALRDEARARIRMRHIGFVFQKLNLIDYLTSEENIRLSLSGNDDDAILAALKQVGMADRARELCVKLSLGEQQRVAVARVLAARPSVILADEPTSSLDAKNANAVMDALFAAAGTSSTLVVVSHDERLRSRFDRSIQFEDLVRA